MRRYLHTPHQRQRMDSCSASEPFIPTPQGCEKYARKLSLDITEVSLGLARKYALQCVVARSWG